MKKESTSEALAKKYRLEAAAPDLLKAAKNAVKLMYGFGYAWKYGVVELRDAIAKAERKS